MKNILKNRFAILLAALCVAVSSTSCSDWTDTERVNIKEPNMEQDNPELYAKYMAALREYKQSAGHKVVYAWFDNSVKVTASRGQHITTVPDSVDVIVLKYADNLTERELTEIEKVRQMGTRVIYNISYDSLLTSYRAYLEKFEEEHPAPEEGAEPSGEEPAVAMTQVEFSADYMTAQVALCGKYNYDGMVINYNGKELTHSTEAEIADYTAKQEAFLKPIAEWKAANPSKMLSLLGRAYNILDKEFVAKFSHIIVPSQYLVSPESIGFEMQKAVALGSPSDRFVALVMTTSLDKSDLKTGYFGLERALSQTAYWIMTPEAAYTKAGIAILDVQNDFYNPLLIYKYTREAIATMN